MALETVQTWWTQVQKREGFGQKLDYTRGFVRGYYAGYKSAKE